MGKGSKSGGCKSASHQIFKDRAKNRVDDLQGMFTNLQSARKESRTIDVAVLEEQVHQMLREWKSELNEPSPASSLQGGSLGSFSSDIYRLLLLCEEEDDATSPLAAPKPEPDAQKVGGGTRFQEGFSVNQGPQGQDFQLVNQCKGSPSVVQNMGVNNLGFPSQLDYHVYDLHQEVEQNFFSGVDGMGLYEEHATHQISGYLPDICPPPSAFLGPKCALWDCPRPAQGSDWCQDYCSSFHAALALNEGPPGMTPVLRPGGIGLKDGLLFAALSAKAQGKDVGIPECEGAATAKSPWNAHELFDLIVLEGETIREWLFFDKPRRAFESGNRKQRSLPDYNGRGWHESRKQVMNEYGGLKRSYYMDPQPRKDFEWHLYEIARSLIGDPNFSWIVNLKEFAHPALEIFSAVGSVGPTFFLAIAMFGFVFQISSLITEKELKLRQAMTMMGLYDTAYWFSWLTWEGIITLLSSVLTVLFGMMFQFNFFLHNSFAIVFLLFFLFQFNMIGFAFMLSAFISKSSSSTTVGFSIFIIGFLTQIITQFGFPYSNNFSSTYRIIWSLFPPNLLAEGLTLLSDATATPEDPGISWSRRGKCAPNDTECVVTINDIYNWLISTFLLWFVLAIYFDNIIPNSSGVRKSLFYFLNPGYWTGKGGNKVAEGGICSCTSSVPPLEDITLDDCDVLAEENTVKQQAREGIDDPNIAVQIRGLAKIYPGTTKIGCCKCKKSSHYHALKGLWVNFAKDQLFCLLGPNGAGKTTAINCLTGIIPVTAGDALIYGNSVRSSVGMSNIRRIIGVCPQFDILWDALSGQEHLHLFASIKGLPPASIESVAQKSLAEVRLTEAAKIRAGSYSGGMKRRLSVAIALIGDPKLVIMDEPTTGMDPITRRHVWDIIENAKRGRAIILTTHSMEEADILSDRIGIMAKGRLRCIGTSVRLKSRFGTGFIANISFSGGPNRTPVRGEDVTIMHHEALKQFFKNHLNVVPKEENKSFLTYVIPHDKEKLLTNFFAELQDRESEFGIADIQLGLTTLEEVFLNIAKQAELESAAAEGSLATLTLTSGTSVQIPIGARFVGIPGTESAENPRGIMVEVQWEQDDSGALCIAGQSAETPIPPHVQLTASTTTSHRNILGRTGPIQGIMIDPNQIGTVNSQ